MTARKRAPKEKPDVIIKTIIHLCDEKSWTQKITVEGDYGDSMVYILRVLKRIKFDQSLIPDAEPFEWVEYEFRKWMQSLERITLNYYCKHLHFDMDMGYSTSCYTDLI